VLHYFNEMSIEEISKVMDMGKSAVKMRLKRARDELERNLSKRRDTL
jgi:DNA-directed RNA polymerase specialized sigma24 family protein